MGVREEIKEGAWVLKGLSIWGDGEGCDEDCGGDAG